MAGEPEVVPVAVRLAGPKEAYCDVPTGIFTCVGPNVPVLLAVVDVMTVPSSETFTASAGANPTPEAEAGVAGVPQHCPPIEIVGPVPAETVNVLRPVLGVDKKADRSAWPFVPTALANASS